MGDDDAKRPRARGGKEGGTDGAGVVLFNCTKGELFTPSQGYKQFARRLRTSHRPAANKEELNSKTLAEAAVLVLGAPTEKFSVAELEALKKYVMGGGSLLVCMGEGGEKKHPTNINYLLEQFGMSVNSDCVVRTVHYKYFHPKEALITDGIINREINTQCGKVNRTELEDVSNRERDSMAADEGVHFVLPYGATLTVQKPAISILSSGRIAYPMHRPVGAVWEKRGAGKICVLGSGLMFSDEWIGKEENDKLLDFVVRWLSPGSKIRMYNVDAEDPDVNEYQHLPDTEALAERLRVCLQEGEELPKDFTTMFNDDLFRMHTNYVPEAVRLYALLDVKKAPLTLIAPQFDTQLPPLQPAVFPPALREGAPPALDLFDLDEAFAGEKLRLAQLTNKCADNTAEDLEYFITEGAGILGVKAEGSDSGDMSSQRMAKHLLAKIFKQVVGFKMASHLHEEHGGGYVQGLEMM